MKIGITERGDAGLDLSWKPWVDSGKPAILITKNPGKLVPHIKPEHNVIIHCTITGFGGTIIEPNVPEVKETVQAYVFFMKTRPEGSVVLRVDPIIPTEKGILRTVDTIVYTNRQIGISRLRISFMDNYPHVKARFKELGLPHLGYNFHAPLSQRVKITEELQQLLSFTPIEICGEPDMKCTGCVSAQDLKVLMTTTDNLTIGKQRPTCACLAMKQELLDSKKQCGHKCAYCYWK